jgi:hypothetical protein
MQMEAMTRMVDFHQIKAEHKIIDAMCQNWAMWVRVRPRSFVNPMFKQYRSNAWQWHKPEYRHTCDTIEAQEMEKLMRHLPKHIRDSIVWAYVVRSSPVHARSVLGCTYADLGEYIHQGRTMLCNLWARHHQQQGVTA